MRALVAAIALGSLALSILSGCAARAIRVPTDAGTPLPDFNTIHREITRACAGAKTFSAVLALSGRSGSQRIRGRVLAGFARPGPDVSMRLEGVAPFGAPVFILVAQGIKTTLLLPRDDRVAYSDAAQSMLEALIGVPLDQDALMAILGGCASFAAVESGSLHADGWASLRLSDGSVLYLQRNGAGWQLRAAQRAGWQIEYPPWSGDFPAVLHLRSTAGGDASVASVDLIARISQVEANATLGADAFTVTVPASAIPLSQADLRNLGPLRGSE